MELVDSECSTSGRDKTETAVELNMNLPDRPRFQHEVSTSNVPSKLGLLKAE